MSSTRELVFAASSILYTAGCFTYFCIVNKIDKPIAYIVGCLALALVVSIKYFQVQQDMAKCRRLVYSSACTACTLMVMFLARLCKPREDDDQDGSSTQIFMILYGSMLFGIFLIVWLTVACCAGCIFNAQTDFYVSWFRVLCMVLCPIGVILSFLTILDVANKIDHLRHKIPDLLSVASMFSYHLHTLAFSSSTACNYCECHCCKSAGDQEYVMMTTRIR